MSAGGLLEIPAFLVGLSGLITLVENGFRLWQLITASQYFGEALVKTMCKLQFEYALFHAWCEGFGISPTTAGASSLLGTVPPRPAVPGLADGLRNQSRSPFYITVSQIVDTLEQIQQITTKLSSEADDHDVQTGLVGTATQGVLAVAVARAALAVSVHWQKKSREHGLNKMSFFRRAKLQMAASATSSEHGRLEKLIGEFAELNRNLWEFLPSARKDAVLSTYLPVTVLDIPFDRQDLRILQEASRGNFPAISNTAHLWIEKEQIELAADEVIFPPISTGRLHLSPTRDGPWQLATLEDVDGRASRRVVVEWYEYDNLSDTQTAVSTQTAVATARISNLSRTTRLSPDISDLRILSSPGYVSTTDSTGLHLGLLFDLPPAADPEKRPVSLASLFAKNNSNRSPKELSLRQKFILANQLAVSLAAFHRVHWYHKNFSATSIVFFYSRADPTTLLSAHPYISGFGFSRPDDPAALSLNPHWDMHIHPELQHDADPARPKFQRRHDIYSLGVLLFDIGTWGAAELYKKDGELAENFRRRLERYAPDLRGRMGVEYMKVTRWCLRPTGEETHIGLETFYWKVLQELANCHCSARAVGA